MGAPAASRLRVAALLALRRGARACAALRPCVRRPAASGRRGPLRLHSKAPHRSPSLRLRSRCALRSMPPIGRHHCALRSRRRAPANGSGDVAVSPDARLRPQVGAATPERSHGSRSRSPRLSRGRDTLRPGSGYARIDFVRTKSPGPRRKAAPAGQPPPRLPGESMRYNRMRGRFAAWAAPTV